MAYTPTIWSENDIITAEKLNNIEEGIDNTLEISVSGEEFNQALTEGLIIEDSSDLLEKYLKNNIKYIKLKINTEEANITVSFCYIYQNDSETIFCSNDFLKTLLGKNLFCTVGFPSETKIVFIFTDPNESSSSIPELYNLGEIVLENNNFSKTITLEDYETLKSVKFLTFSIKSEDEKFITDYLLYKGDYLHHTTSGGYPTDSISFCNLKCSTDDSNNLHIENIIAKASCYFGPDYTYTIYINFTPYTIIPTNSST